MTSQAAEIIIISIKSDDSDLFISSQKNSEKEAATLQEKLETIKKMRVWRDHNDGVLGEPLEKRIIVSKIFLCLITKHYVESVNCLKEVSFAARLGKTIIFLVIEKLSTEEMGDIVGSLIGTSICIQCFNHASSWWQDDFEEIARSIEAELKAIKMVA